jgi:hypothetical protein
MRERKAYIILVLISVVLSMGAYFLAVQAINNTQHKFCDIVNAVTADPIPKPSDPISNPSRERSYEFYLKFQVLDSRLGC